MIVTSPAFTNNGNIPVKHTGFGEDKSPEFQISEVPENTVSFAIIFDDLDVPWVKKLLPRSKAAVFHQKRTQVCLLFLCARYFFRNF